MTLFTLKYQPQNEQQLFGQQKAVGELKDFITNYKTKKSKAALLYGPIGVGKTSSVYALAKQLDYDLLEINSSDLRNKDKMETFLGSALGQQSLFFRPKLILIDEIDNLSGVKDRGCIPALIKAIENSSFPVILTANDPFDSKFKMLRKTCQNIEYHKLQYRTIAHALQWVCEQENIQTEEKAINSLARQVDGDLRGALIDLQSSLAKKSFVFADITTLSDRKRTDTILNALTIIFKSSNVENALSAFEDVDLKLNEIFLWLDNNLPHEYVKAKDLAKAYEFVARADVFNGRIRRQQHWRFLVYIYNLLTAGVSSAKSERNTNFVQYKPTMRLLRIWQSNIKNAKKKDIAGKLAGKTHVSKKQALEQVLYLKNIFSNGGGEKIASELELSDDEINWLKK
jgi:replication factor C large subunit